MTQTVCTCPECGVERLIKKNIKVRTCKSCAQKRAQKGRTLGPQTDGRVCKCGKNLRRDNQTGYCTGCFLTNVDGVRTADSLRRQESMTLADHVRHRNNNGYNITEKDLVSFEAETNCNICGREFKSNNKCFDHCHDTGAYRGALCRTCNGFLGTLGDDLTDIILRLQRYQKKLE